ncbi:hypothetical protein [Nocardia brevicatena]|nr:hypothetical protein [Nocardia brevicatena]
MVATSLGDDFKNIGVPLTDRGLSERWFVGDATVEFGYIGGQ